MAELKAYDPTLRERLSALLQGDAKTGSIRQHLVHGLLGGSVDENDESRNMPLVDMTPMGAVFAGQTASRAAKSGSIGKGLSAMAGMAGPEGKMGVAAISKLIDAADHTMTPELLEQVGKGLVDHAPGKVKAFLSGKGLNPNSIKEALVHHAAAREALGSEADPEAQAMLDHVTGNTAADDFKRGVPRSDAEAAAQLRLTGTSPGKPSEYEAAKRNLDSARAPQPARDIGSGAGYGDVDKRAVIAAAKGDPAKEHFIMQAMQDEGGNVPEDVAATLVDHLNQGKTTDASDQLLSLLDRHNLEMDDEGQFDAGELAKVLAQSHSIPEMLAMHYDLNPSLMGKAYKQEQRAATSTKAKDLLAGAKGASSKRSINAQPTEEELAGLEELHTWDLLKSSKLVPARRMSNGTILEANRGETHAHLMDENELDDSMEHGWDTVGDFGFTYPGSGKFLTQEETLAELKRKKGKRPTQ